MRSLLVGPMKIALFFSGIFLLACNVHALTVDEVIRLAEAGVEDRTIQMLMHQEKIDREGVGVREIKRADGGRDIVYSSTSSSEEIKTLEQEEKMKMERALEILRNVEIYQKKK